MSDQKAIPFEKYYVHVSAKHGENDFGQMLPAWGYTETDPRELILHWKKDGGMFIPHGNGPGIFIRWAQIDEVRWERRD